MDFEIDFLAFTFQLKFKSGRFGFFALWHINICRLFNAKAILLE